MILQRHVKGIHPRPTLGRLTSKDGAFTCVTLERPADDPDHPCVPAAVYFVVLDQHHPGTLHSYPCPELRDVPGRSDIQIHVLNRVEQSLGCIGPGENISADGLEIEHSQHAFDRLMSYLLVPKTAFPFTLEIRDP